MTGLPAYLGLFAAAFVAATVIPAQSEAVFVGLLMTNDYSLVLLLLFATSGNVLGSAVNWLLGRWIERFQDRRWFPASPAALARARGWYARYGRWTLLLSWLPIGGDTLTIVAGVMREPLWSFLLIVTIAKAGRYIVLAAIATQLL